MHWCVNGMRALQSQGSVSGGWGLEFGGGGGLLTALQCVAVGEGTGDSNLCHGRVLVCGWNECASISVPGWVGGEG